MPAIEYKITPVDTDGHHFQVDLMIREPNPDGQRVQLPSWIPGSYLIRDFSKHLERIEAFQLNTKGKSSELKLKKMNSHTWEIPIVKGPVYIRSVHYAFDTSVRTAYLDRQRGFFNPSSLCLQVLGQAHLPCHVTINPPSENAHWEVQTTLSKRTTDRKGFGNYLAANYDELIDHPVGLGSFSIVRWKSHGISHRMAIQGHIGEIDSQRLRNDLQAVCEKHIALFDPHKKRAPFTEYLFLVNAVGQGYGGLEHRSSTALLCNRSDLPYVSNQREKTLPNQKNYNDFLGLCSHEYFHAWMVKKIQPKVFQPYMLDRRNYTQLLWLFEGFTSYYDDLQLFRSGAFDRTTYLNRILDTWNMVLRNPGRKIQSVAESSFDAWTKYYQADENTPNSVVSYYAKGSLVALALDLVIREYSQNKKSLDDVMHTLWKKHGSFSNQPGQGLGEDHQPDDFTSVVRDSLGSSFIPTWKKFHERYIQGTTDLPLEALLAKQGISLKLKKFSGSEKIKAILGIRTSNHDGWVRITHVLNDGTAERGGLAAGDILASINSERITPARFDAILSQLSGSKALFYVFRHDLALELNVSIMGSTWDQYQLNETTER